MKLSERLDRIKPSATLAITAKAKALKAEGKDIVSLSAGEPDFGTPQHICDAAIAAIHAGDTHYTAVDGTPELKAAIIEKLKRDNGLTYEPAEIIASCGAKHSLYNLFGAILNPGDEVIIPAPYWVSYPDMVILSDGKPVILDTNEASGLKITAEQLEAAITPKTKALVLNSPSNPTGAVYTRAELTALANVLKKHPHVLIISDDIYEHILWADEPYANILNVAPELKSQTIVINGASKGYAMTGWRLGFAAGPAAIVSAMRKLQSQSTSNPSSIVQAAGVAAFAGDQECLKPMRDAFKARHDFFIPALNSLNGISCLPAHGAFYAFPNVEGAIKNLGLKDDLAFAEHLIDKALVAAVPGSAFGTPGFMRMSYATSMEQLEKTIERLQQVL